MRRQNLKPAELNDLLMKFQVKEFNYLFKHFVCLGITITQINSDQKPKGEPLAFIFPGCILSVRGIWFWLTAGHSLSLLERKLADPTLRLSAMLIDRLDPEAPYQTDILFDYKNATKIIEWDDGGPTGVDYGLILLSQLTRESLEKNNIVPLTEENWRDQDSMEFDEFGVLGIPVDTISYNPNLPNNFQRIPIDYLPVLVKPIEIKKPDESNLKLCPRFSGKIADISEYGFQQGMKGMSGGPIFAWNKDGYSIVAVQSGWWEQSLVIYGCPIFIVAQAMENMIAKLEQFTHKS